MGKFNKNGYLKISTELFWVTNKSPSIIKRENPIRKAVG